MRATSTPPDGERPCVSLIVPCYNSEPHLEATVQSCLDQSYAPIEVLLIDDGSTDGTPALLGELCRRSRPGQVSLRTIRQENAGFLVARNRGLDACRGDLIGFLDHDDLLPPHRVERLVDALRGRRMAYAYGRTVDFHTDAQAAELLASDPGLPEVESVPLTPTCRHLIPDVFEFLMTRDLATAVGRFYTGSRREDDWSFIVRLRHHAHTALRLRSLSYLHRKHAVSMSATMAPTRIEDRVRVVREVSAVMGRLGLDDPPELRQLQRMCWTVVRSSLQASSARCVRDALAVLRAASPPHKRLALGLASTLLRVPGVYALARWLTGVRRRRLRARSAPDRR